MNESGNIKKHELSFIGQGSESPAMMYIEVIKSIQQRYESLLEGYKELQKRNDNLQGKCELLEQQVEHLKNEVSAFAMEKAQWQQQRQQQRQASGYELLPSYDGEPIPRVANRKKSPQLINPDTVGRIKADRRHYPVVCDAALTYWQRLLDNGFVDSLLRATPTCGVTVAARIVCCFQNEVDPNIRWSFFEKHWGMRHLQSNLHRSTYRDEKKYVIVNRIFCRADDAPFVPKSLMEE